MPQVFSSPQGSPPEPTGPRVISKMNQPASIAIGIVGRWQGQHPLWSGIIEFKADGTFKAGYGTGRWTFDGKRLTLAWEKYGVEGIDLHPDGTFRQQMPKGTFVLRRM